MVKRTFSLILVADSIVLLSLFFYSFTQIDLNLTLSKASVFKAVEGFFINIGYFQRPLSAGIFLAIIFTLFAFYYRILSLANRNNITHHQLWKLIVLTVAVLLFSYPAFSYDLFNYLFDARIFTHYQLNPYFFKALDFPQDPWTRFMHWTHRNYPYGPSWLLLSLPFSYLGFGKFILTLYNFKVLMAASYVGTVYLIGKILAKINPERRILGMAFFAFNPLVVIESLVSAHNDIVMMFFGLLAVYLILVGKRFYSFASLVLSAGIKYVTIFLIPFLIIGFYPYLAVIFSTSGLLYVISKMEIQPWYFLWILPFIALKPKMKLLAFFSFGFSLGLLLRYAPYLYFGNWDNPVPQIEGWLTLFPAVILILCFLIFRGGSKTYNRP